MFSIPIVRVGQVRTTKKSGGFFRHSSSVNDQRGSLYALGAVQKDCCLDPSEPPMITRELQTPLGS